MSRARVPCDADLQRFLVQYKDVPWGYKEVPGGSGEHHDHGAGSDEQAAGDGRERDFFAEQEPRQEDDERDGELVKRRNAGGGTELQGAEVA